MASIKLKLLKQSERHGGCMSNYVKNLMKAAGVKPETVTDYELNEYHIYPEFTPAKQLELIKLLAERMNYGYIGGQIDYFTGTEALVFDEAIAQIISNAISSKILDKSKVRRILSE